MSSLHYDAAERPRPKSTPVNSAGVFLEDECIVVPDGFVFPQVCAVTGEAVLTQPREFQFARTTRVDGPVMMPGNLKSFVGAAKLAHSGSTVKVRLCLNERLTRRRRNLGIAAITTALLALPLPIALAAWFDHGGWLVLTFPMLLAAPLLKWRRDSIVKARKVTSSFAWLSNVHPTVREQTYQSGLK